MVLVASCACFSLFVFFVFSFFYRFFVLGTMKESYCCCNMLIVIDLCLFYCSIQFVEGVQDVG